MAGTPPTTSNQALTSSYTSIFGKRSDRTESTLDEQPRKRAKLDSCVASQESEDESSWPYVSDNSETDTPLVSQPPEQSDVGLQKPTPTQAPTIFQTFDDNPDLTILVGTSPVAEFRVSSQAMAGASEAWEAMLYGSFMERKPEAGDWVVSFPEDNWEAFQIALDMINGNSSKVPVKMQLFTMHNLLEFIDKWDLFQMFAPWRQTWSTDLVHYWNVRHQDDLDIDPSVRFGYVLSAAWMLGEDELIARMLRSLVKHSCLDYSSDNQLKLCHDDDKVFPITDHIDTDLLNDAVIENRDAVLKQIQETWADPYMALVQHGSLTCKQEHCTLKTRQLCQRSLLGSFLQGIYRVGMTPLWLEAGSDVVIFASLHNLGANLLSISLQTMEKRQNANHTVSCNPTYRLHAITRAWLLPEAVVPGDCPLKTNLLEAVAGERKKWVAK